MDAGGVGPTKVTHIHPHTKGDYLKGCGSCAPFLRFSWQQTQAEEEEAKPSHQVLLFHLTRGHRLKKDSDVHRSIMF